MKQSFFLCLVATISFFSFSFHLSIYVECFIYLILLCYRGGFSFRAAPPEITVERSWVHASEGYDIELACIVHGDVTSDVSTKAE